MDTCAEMYEPVPSGYPHSLESWRRGTHTCDQEAGHPLPHHCPVCNSSWVTGRVALPMQRIG